MKTLTANALAEISKELGTEPINIVGVAWSDDNSIIYYADRDLIEGSVKISGKLLELGEINSVLRVNGNPTSSVTITLSDIDGSIKNILDTVDIHKKDCILYQYFGDLSQDDKFIISKGQISTPVVWSEGERRVQFTVLSEIEDREVGFTPEEGQFDFVSYDKIGEPWPLCFGHVVHVPATKVKQVVTGTLKDQMGYADPTLEVKMKLVRKAYHDQLLVANFFEAIAVAADKIAPPVADIIVAYCAAITAEDQQLRNMAALEALAEGYKRIIAKGGNQARASRIRLEELEFFITNVHAPNLNAAQENKRKIEEQAALAQFEYNVKQSAFQQQVESINNARELYGTYTELKLELCRQKKLEKTEILIENGEHFPQNQEVDLVIKGLRWRGTFNGNIFTNISDPVARYTDVPLGGRVDDDDCMTDLPTLQNLSSFWVDDPKYQLKDMYCWVYSAYDERHHIIKIREQIGTKCIFELVKFNKNTTGGQNMVNSKVPLPEFKGPFLGADGVLIPLPKGFGFDDLKPGNYNQNKLTLTNDTLRLLTNANPINLEEFSVLASLERILPSDLASDAILVPKIGPHDVFTIIGTDIVQILEVAAVPLESWFGDIYLEEIPDSVFWLAEVGSTVFENGKDSEIYVANILPSEVKAVMAYRTLSTEGNKRVLTPIPSSYYEKNEDNDIGPIHITSFKFFQPLTTFVNENWEDDIYVTLNSSVGPNVVDILEHLITTYTDKGIDSTSFNDVRDKFRDGGTAYENELYPANFALFDRKNVFEQLDEIAWQARCVIYEINGTFYLKYLAEIPTSVATLVEDDIAVASMEIHYTETEDLVTKLVAEWRENYLPETKVRQVILRHNVKKYGLQEKKFDFYIYNIQNLVEKSATFWLIRYANTWKKLHFDTFLTNLQLDALDTITLDFLSAYVASEDILATIEEVVFNTNDNVLTLDLWLPVRSGEMTTYPFAWPASLESDVEFPTNADIAIGYAGGTGIGTTVSEVS